jgi:hypothetical protein
MKNRLGSLVATVLLALVGLGAGATVANASPVTADAVTAKSVSAKSVSAGVVTPFAGVFHPIQNVGNGLCLQPTSFDDGAPIVQLDCNSSILQGWQFIQLATNHYRFLNQSGWCLDTFGPAANGTPMVQGECKPISNEEFNTGASLPNVVILEARVGFRDTGFCVDVPGAQNTRGLAMQIYRCNGTLAQRWVVGF